MRGVRSLILLLVIALPLGWYAYRDYQKRVSMLFPWAPRRGA